jgi:SAM-dependent methyltransferase
MPSSVSYFDHIFSSHINSFKPKKVLDIGCGYGKYGRIIKGLFPTCEIHAVEPEKSYIDRFPKNDGKGIESVYGKVFNKDIISFIKDDMNGQEKYDVVICGDVLEHMFLSEALDVVNFFSYRCAWLVAQFPTHFPQYAVDGIKWEMHKSNLDLNHFFQYNIQYYIKQKDHYNIYHHYILMSMDMCDGSKSVL